MRTQNFESQSDLRLDRSLSSGAVAFGAGVLGVFVMAVGMAIIRAAGLSAANLEMQLGRIFLSSVTVATWTLGFFLELIVGGLMGLFYAAMFRLTGKSGGILGASMGLAQWFVLASALPMAASLGTTMPMEPYTPTDYMGGGFDFGSLFGPLLFFNVLYGALVAEIYQRFFEDVGTVGLGELAAADQDQLHPSEDPLRPAA